MRRISVLSVLLLVAVATTGSTATTECNLQVKECSSVVKELTIDSLMIPGCCEWPCKLHRNSTALIIINFHTDVSYSIIDQQLFTVIGGIFIPAYNQLPTSVCDLISCPLKAGNHYQITEKIVLPESSPDIAFLTVIVFSGNDNGNRTSIGCLSMDIRLTPPM